MEEEKKGRRKGRREQREGRKREVKKREKKWWERGRRGRKEPTPTRKVSSMEKARLRRPASRNGFYYQARGRGRDVLSTPSLPVIHPRHQTVHPAPT